MVYVPAIYWLLQLICRHELRSCDKLATASFISAWIKSLRYMNYGPAIYWLLQFICRHKLRSSDILATATYMLALFIWMWYIGYCNPYVGLNYVPAIYWLLQLKCQDEITDICWIECVIKFYLTSGYGHQYFLRVAKSRVKVEISMATSQKQTIYSV